MELWIEDYAYSYMKKKVLEKSNLLEGYDEREKKVILYGIETKEREIPQYSIYGIALLKEFSIKHEDLSLEELEEAEKLKQEFFPQYELIAFGVLSREMPQGFYLYSFQKGKWIMGYTVFFEQNDKMISYMLWERKCIQQKIKNEDEPQTLSVDMKKENHKEKRGGKIWSTLVMCVLLFALLGGKMITWNRENWNIRQVGQPMDEKEEQEEIILEENYITKERMFVIPEKLAEEPMEEIKEKEYTEPVLEQEEYQIQKGDTLLGISRKKYGTENMVSAICELNRIENPDSIEIGQIILLP